MSFFKIKDPKTRKIDKKTHSRARMADSPRRSLSETRPLPPSSVSAPSPPPQSPSPAEEDAGAEGEAEAPLTMAASVVLTNLPRDASKALDEAGRLGVEKGMFSSLFLPFLSLRYSSGEGEKGRD